MKTLASKHNEAFQRLSKAGFPNIASMLTCFYRQSDMDRALGLVSATNHWLMGRNTPSRRTEKAAELFMASMSAKTGSAKVQSEPEPKPEVVETTVMPTPVQEPMPEASDTLLVVCPPEKMAKVQKVLGVLGCEVVEV